MKIVLDTNVLISGIFWRGKPYKILELWVQNKLEIVASQAIAYEYGRVLYELEQERLSDKNQSMPLSQQWKHFFEQHLIFVKITTDLHLCRDPHDDMFINCALSGNVDYLLSGDKDLLVLKQVNDIKIITPSCFLNHFSCS